MNRQQRIKELTKAILEEDPQDLRGVSLLEALGNFGIGAVLVFVVALHLALSLWQVVVALLLVGYDLIAKGLAKAMEAPKKPARHSGL